MLFCDAYRIQTCNLLIRSQMLYSVELMRQTFVVCECKVTTFFRICKIFRELFSIFFVAEFFLGYSISQSSIERSLEEKFAPIFMTWRPSDLKGSR